MQEKSITEHYYLLVKFALLFFIVSILNFVFSDIAHYLSLEKPIKYSCYFMIIGCSYYLCAKLLKQHYYLLQLIHKK